MSEVLAVAASRKSASSLGGGVPLQGAPQTAATWERMEAELMRFLSRAFFSLLRVTPSAQTRESAVDNDHDQDAELEQLGVDGGFGACGHGRDLPAVIFWFFLSVYRGKGPATSGFERGQNKKSYDFS